MLRKVVSLLAVLAVLSMVVTACGPTPEPQVVKETVVVTEKETVVVEKLVQVTPTPEPVPEEEPKVVLKWSGGSFYEACNEQWVEPFMEETGIEVDYLEGQLLPAMLKAMVDSGNVTVDLFGGDPWSGGKLAELGLVQKINWDWMEPQLMDEIPEEFRTGPIYSYGIPAIGGSRVLCYRTDVFDEPPTSWADFWDVEKFPGPRALWWGGYGDPDIEMALFALGYSADEMKEISIEMLDEAYAKLDEIKPHIVKWTSAGAESAEMLARGEVVMTDSHNGRVQAVIDAGAPVKIVWNQARHSNNWMAIPTGAPHPRNAHRLLSYMLRAENQARFQKAFSYGGPNPKAKEFHTPERWEMLPTAHYDEGVRPSFLFYNQPIDPDDIFGPTWAMWLAETWPAFEAAAPGEWIPSEHIGK